MKNHSTSLEQYMWHERIGVYGVLSLLFIAPFAHTVALRYLALLLCLIFVSIDVIKKGFDKNTPFLLVIPFWLIITWMSVFYSVDPGYTLGELKHETLYTLLVFYTAFRLVPERIDLCFLFRIMSLSFALMTLGVLAQYMYFGHWYKGYFSGVGDYTTYLMIYIPIMIYQYLNESSTWWKQFSLAVLILSLIAGFLAENRMLWIAFFVHTT